MAVILGLDLGTNSIGWALTQQDFENSTGKILGLGSRIIPMSQDILGDFGKGNSISQTAERTSYRGVRRLRERHLLRRERLHRVLHVLGFLPKHYASQIDFEKRFGQFKEDTEPKIAWSKDDEGKFHFIFQKSFNEMVAEFKGADQDIKLPYDWTLYYLRKKALSQPIAKEELAWIILNFNQKRGYYQLRGEEEEENPNKRIEFYSLKVIEVVADEEPNRKGEMWYSMHLENGWIYRRSSKIDLSDWKNKVKDFIVTTDLNDDGSIKLNKDGEEKRSFRAPKEDDWTLIKKRTEQDIEDSKKSVGTYIFENLLKDPTQKIKGKLIRTIERKFYKDELKAILTKQKELQPELFTSSLYNDCIRELYKNNNAHCLQLEKRDFVHLFLNDIIFYQRPLKSQKSSIGNCILEFHTFRNEEGLEQTQYLKAIPKSNPYYQEFRVWQWLYNLKIYGKDGDHDVTNLFIKNVGDQEKLFEFLMNQKEVDHKTILKYLLIPHKLKGKALSTEIGKYRWNYVYDSEKDESKKYPMNETHYEIKKRLEKVEGISKDFLTREIEQHLWHLIYSVTDKIEYEKALKTFAATYDLNQDSFLENFIRFKPFPSDYGRYSEKAIKKLLPLMRLGKYWNWKEIDDQTKNRISKIINAEDDSEIRLLIREKAQKLKLESESDFQGLQLWLAQYIVYNRHSEANIVGKWSSVKDLEDYLNKFKQHTLRNPIVEQVIMETLRVVKDIWKQYGKGMKDFFNEIHVELGREMKNPADKRKSLTTMVLENENTNERIKTMLVELRNDSSVENVRPYSPMQQQALKIYEEGVLNSGIAIPEEIDKISKKSTPSKSEIQRYKLWLEQKYKSPYTGQTIPLTKLFTSAYEIEHIIPQSRYFDDSFNNKVICEAAVNKLKDNLLGLEFIQKHHGEKVECGQGRVVELFSESAYKNFVKEHYSKNRGKRNKLLLDEIPEKMIERQLNDTRYISKFVSNLLSNIVRAEKNDEGINSKNLVPGNGKITGILKQDWGLNDIWNELILPRFERMNQLTNTEDYTSINTNGKIIPTVPIELSKGFNKKRIDHRHHALDALVIACATRDHINLLNNRYAKSKERYDLQYKLRNTKKWQDKNGTLKDKFTSFKMPWKNFTVDSKNQLEKTIISFKQNIRVINKATNKYERYVDYSGEKRKELVEQKGTNWAIRRPMHKETVSGQVNLPRVKVPKGKILTATRKSLDTSFNFKTINSITDTGIQKILKNYLATKDNNPELAFSPEGIEDMNKNIAQYNDGKPHQPILKMRIFELGSKFPVGYKGNKSKKFVEAAKGTNLFFAIYWDEKKQKRVFQTIPLNIVIERQKQGLNAVPEIDENGNVLLFHLSPNDLVYVPAPEENVDIIDFDTLSKKRLTPVYKMVSSTGSKCHFIHSNISALIKNYDAKTKFGELGSLNKLETTIDNSIRIKETCIKLQVDRLGNIMKV
ncbi:type II CRISPR RNA-guided endonuclease Cas9 [Zhouia sp. PK063]|uniref:type II CRISPR RNA-guided endonuclease Cas9 n=1 Tax=Zhouia sp. PK063 TaxID=3373602 RepID=UPI0037B07A91